MADPTAERESVVETLLEKIDDKFHGEDSSSSDSDTEVKSPSSSAVKAKIYRLFGREEPLHKVLGGGKPADIFLWRQKKITAGVLGVATTIWVLFELFEYHLLTLLCHILILAFTALFLWSNACKFINKAPPPIPDFELPADIVTGVASAFRIEINRALALIHQTAAGKDLKKFLLISLECSTRNPGLSGACHEILDFVWRVMPTPHMLSDGILDFVPVAGLWIISIIGGYCHFLTLFYISFVLLHTIPVIYEKYEDQVDSIAEKAEAEIKKHFAEFNVKFLSKIPIKQLKEKKFA